MNLAWNRIGQDHRAAIDIVQENNVHTCPYDCGCIYHGNQKGWEKLRPESHLRAMDV